MTMLRQRVSGPRVRVAVLMLCIGCDGSVSEGKGGDAGRDADSSAQQNPDAGHGNADGEADAGKGAGGEDAAVGRDSGTVTDCEAEYETIEAEGQRIVIESGETFENKLFDLSTGNDVVLHAKGTNWTIRNIGYDGEDRSDKGRVFMGLADTEGGTSIVENVYLGDGATDGNDSDHGHGSNGIWVDPDHDGHLVIRHANIQGMSDNGIYASGPSGNGGGTIHIDQSYAANNYVSSYRIGSGSKVTDSVAFNTADEGYNGRCFWGWPGEEEMEISGCDFDSGPYPDAIHLGREGESTSVYIEDTQYDGISERGDVEIRAGGGNGSSPDLSIPEGVPTSPEEAASTCSRD